MPTMGEPPSSRRGSFRLARAHTSTAPLWRRSRGRCYRRLSGDGDHVAECAEALERLALELPHPLASEPQLVADGLERPGIALESEAQLEDPPLALRQRIERSAHALLPQRLLGLLERIRSLAVGEEVTKLP